MNNDELLEYLHPVKKFFKASKVTTGSVLAAYMRRDGLAVKGDVWDIAQAAVAAGKSFENAVQIAGSHTAKGTNRRQINTDSGKIFSSGIQLNSNELSSTERNCSTNIELEWCPKARRPGDMDGDGLQKLLGAPSHDKLSILIRETAQNSWDARRLGVTPSLSYSLRTANPELRRLLNNLFLRNGAIPGTNLAASLAKEHMNVLEVCDKGTTGLGGPTRNDIEIPSEVPEDFANFVLNIGVPRDTDMGGGTYGFGKIAGYRASLCRTVIIWTRCVHNGQPEHRLIAVTLGSNFTMDGSRYTGHHWWGRKIEDRIEPLIGDEAQTLGESLFSSSFGTDFGTSLMILDADVAEESGDLRTVDFATEIYSQLWPKFVAVGSTNTVPMPIELFVDGEKIDIERLAYTEAPVWKHYRMCLEAVRAVQSGRKNPHERRGVEVQEVRLKRPDTLLGHLALATYFDASDSQAASNYASRICLMRNVAELVVKYEDYPALTDIDVSWCGVFRPVKAVDDAFAEAEPPTHDDWLPHGIEDRLQRSYVNVSLTRRRQLVRSWLMPLDANTNGTDATRQASGLLANELAWLVPAKNVPGSENGPVPHQGNKSGRRTSKSQSEAKVVVVTQEIQHTNEGKTTQMSLSVKLTSTADGWYSVAPTVKAVTEQGEIRAGEIRICDVNGLDVDHLQMKPNEIQDLKIIFPTYILVALDFDILKKGDL